MRNYTTHAMIMALGAVFFLASVAEAQPGTWGKRGRRGGGGCRLLKAPPDVLKAKLGVNDAQAQKIQKIGYNKASKAITARAKAQQLHLQMRMLMQADLPDEAKVLAVLRKIRSVRGTMAEEKIKAKLKVMRLLTKEQRAKLRKACRGGHGKWGHGGRGKGWQGKKGGMGRGHGGGWGAY